MIYHIYANQSNAGDWLSAKGIKQLLYPEPLTTCLCDTPFVPQTVSLLSAATPKDLIIIGGGGLLMDYFIPFWKAFIPFAERIPFCIWGIGACDLKQESSLPPPELVLPLLQKSKLCIVRDQMTRSFLSGLTLPEPVPCPSINIIDPGEQTGKDLLHVVNYTTVGPENYEIMRSAAIAYAAKKGIVYRETNNQVPKDDENALVALLDMYRRSGIILSSALHGCVIGAAMGRKVLAVSGDRKIEGFMNILGLQEWVLEQNMAGAVPEYLASIDRQTDPRSIIDYYREMNRDIGRQILAYARALRHEV